jgi:hypothetical protein
MDEGVNAIDAGEVKLPKKLKAPVLVSENRGHKLALDL